MLAKNMYLIRGNMNMPFGLLSLAFTMLYEFPMLSAYDGGALETRIAALTPITSCRPRLLQAAARGYDQDSQPLIERPDEGSLLAGDGNEGPHLRSSRYFQRC